MKLNYGLIVAIILSLAVWACMVWIAWNYGLYGVLIAIVIAALLILLVLTIRG